MAFFFIYPKGDEMAVPTDTYLRAVLEYSRMKPRIVAALFAPVVDTKFQTPPADCLNVSFLDYGEPSRFVEVLTDTTGATQAWCHENGTLLLTPAPAAADAEIDPTLATPIQMVYYARHLYDAELDSFPTIPVEHLHFVDDLEQAAFLEVQGDAGTSGPSSYSIGQTTVSRDSGTTYTKTRMVALRERVRQALDEPLGLWT